ncbi:MAG: metallophosphoesterase [Muribaculaceae bacterium]|nr:metallophosphoesterase [Muribaculaceae bacterium]
MRFPIIVIAVFIIIDLLVDGYIYMAIKKRAPYSRRRRLLKFQIIESLIFLGILVSLIFMPVRTTSDTLLRVVMWLLYAYLSVYIPKIFWIFIDLIASIPKLSGERRIGWLSGLGSIGAGIIFILMWWGALVNRFNIQVREVEIPIKNLPAAFDGFKIPQFSDLHTGTFGNQTKFVSQLVDEINRLNPDLIVFTGDIVNRNSNELIPFVSILSRLHAKDGVISIMGNHDYGDYTTWQSDKAKQDNLKQLHNLEKKMGWDLLLNQSKNIYRGNDSILIIGVENIGDPPFHVY